MSFVDISDPRYWVRLWTPQECTVIYGQQGSISDHWDAIVDAMTTKETWWCVRVHDKPEVDSDVQLRAKAGK